MVESSDGGRSSESSVSSSRSVPAADHRPRCAGYPWLPSEEPCQSAYISDAFVGRGRTPDLLAESLQQRQRQRIRLGAEPGDVPLRDLQPARHFRAPGNQRRRAPRNEGDSADRGPTARGQRHEQKRRGPEECVPVGPSTSPGRPDQQTDERRREGDAHSRHDAPAGVALRAASAKEGGRRDDQGRDRHQEGELPDEPEPDRDASGRRRDSAPEATDQIGRQPAAGPHQPCTPYQRRGSRRRQSQTPAMVSRMPASARTPAELDSGPSSGRKNVAGEKSGLRSRAALDRRPDSQPQQHRKQE